MVQEVVRNVFPLAALPGKGRDLQRLTRVGLVAGAALSRLERSTFGTIFLAVEPR